MTKNRRRATSWPASLLPTLLLLGVLSGGLSTASSSDDEPIMHMTVTSSR